MQIAFAIELVICVIFVIVFGGEDLKRQLSRRPRQLPLDLDDDGGNDDARTHPGAQLVQRGSSMAIDGPRAQRST